MYHSTAQQAVIGLLRTTDAVRRAFEQMIAPYGITLQQFNVLRILRGAGGPLPTMTIGERLIEQTPGLTRLLDRLEEKALVSRGRCREDRRQVLCTLTEAGRALLARLDEPVARMEAAIVAVLPPDEQQHLIRLLDTLHAECASRQVAVNCDGQTT